MALDNTNLLTPTIIAREGLMQLENNLVMGANVHRAYSSEFAKIGDTLSIRRPVRFSVTDGAIRSNQDVLEGKTSITISSRKHVSWNFTTKDLTLAIQQYSERYMMPANIALANNVDTDLAALYYAFYASAGTPGTTPGTFGVLGDVATLLDNGAVPEDGQRKLILNPAARWSMADALKGIFDTSMPREMVRRGELGTLAGFTVLGDQNVARHTTGAFTTSATPVVNGNQSTTYSTTTDIGTLVTSGWNASSSTVKVGDTFTIAGVNSVNPVSKVSTGNLQQFTVTTAGTSAAGALTISCRPRIIITGPYQTVSAQAGTGAALTFLGTESTAYPQNLGMHRNAMALVMVPLELPDSAGFKARATYRNASIRIVKDYDVDNDEEIIREDILYGVAAIYPELGSRLWG